MTQHRDRNRPATRRTLPRHLARAALIAGMVTFASGCSWFSKSDDDRVDLSDPTASASQLYQEANEAMRRADYETAIKKYETLEGRYPFGAYTEQAQLEVAYAYYKYDEPDSAIAAADRYIQLHPRGDNVAYALYLKGLANMSRGDSLINKIAPPDLSKRDQSVLEEAYKSFSRLVEQYPDSQYVDDASRRLIDVRNSLAKHEVEVAEYYMRRGAWLAAANRAQSALDKYNGSTSTIPALKLLIRAYDKLGLEQERQDAEEILEATRQANAGDS
ncbi:outer membrane protein assembly factor BamD [Guyparkeria halophila]|uniref:Outer membrane protein assembly factor BamD n=1 Tax=Guyparkeria halophila TaxID=47960 RepID=A0A6I6D4G9_9GAMM|nr:outer membrane protein assembly factor BamD [Guyparkeria halophila]QGT79177.1 outer membrane protein assembly factor BamD [Guyparkeria halophila]